MSSGKDIGGRRYGKLVAIKPTGGTKNGSKIWLCQCDCGNTKTTTVRMLNSGKTSSCGCYKIEKARANLTTHNKRNTRLYTIWNHMKDRCYNPNSKIYRFYGGRNIIICDEWKNDFETFYNWAINNGYDDSLTIDRINSFGNYEPSNCRWITIQDQQRNRTNNRFITYNNETKTLSQWATEYGFTWEQLRDRIDKLGWDFEKAILTPIHKQVKYNCIK